MSKATTKVETEPVAESRDAKIDRLMKEIASYLSTAQYPRFEKDILRVGQWEVSTVDNKGKPCRESWDVTPRLLSQIVENFQAFAANYSANAENVADDADEDD